MEEKVLLSIEWEVRLHFHWNDDEKSHLTFVVELFSWWRREIRWRFQISSIVDGDTSSTIADFKDQRTLSIVVLFF